MRKQKAEMMSVRRAVIRALRQSFLSFLSLLPFAAASAQNEGSDPLTMVASSSGTLVWRNGESVAGHLRGAREGEITFETEYFKEPLVLEQRYLKSLEFSEQAVVTDATWRVRLAGGDVLCGEIGGMDAETLTLMTKRHGSVRILRAEVLVLERVHDGIDRAFSGQFVHGGPFEAGWGQLGAAMGQQTWKALRGGELALPFWKRAIHLPLKFPAKTELEVELRSKERLRFSLGLGKGGQSNQRGNDPFAADAINNRNPGTSVRPTVETWDDELVLVQGARFVPLMTLKNDVRELGLRLCWGDESKMMRVFDTSGKLLGEITDEMAASGAGIDGVSIANEGADLVVESVRAREWNGKPTMARVKDGASVELADGRVIAGAVVSATEKELVVGETVAWAFVDRVSFGGKTDGTDKTGADATTEFWFADGGIVSGRLTGIDAAGAVVKTRWAAEAVRSQLQGARLVSFVGKDAVNEQNVETQDRIVISGTSFRGKFAPRGDASICWLPVGGVKPVEVTVWPHMQIIRGAAVKPVAVQPALFFTKNGEIIAGAMTSMNEMMVNVKPSFTRESPLPVAGIQAAQFAGQAVAGEGFSDSGWRVMRGEEKLVERTGNRVTLSPGSSFGHLSILQGEEIEFGLMPAAGYGILRTRLFTGDPSSRKDGLALLFMHYGSQIHVGVDRGDEQANNQGFNNATQRRVPQGQPARVRLAINEGNVELFINDVPAEKFPIIADKVTGAGLVFEPAAMNGNPETAMTITDFKLMKASSAMWSPSVDPVGKENALVVPRFRRDAPPKHALLAANGDLLRGTVQAATSTHIRMGIGVETVDVPRDRVAAMVWLKAPPAKGEMPLVEAAGDKELESWKVSSKAPWFLLRDGGRVKLAVEKFEADRVIGSCTLFGKCEVPLDLIASIHLSSPPPSRAMLSYQRWNLRHAPEPVLPEGGGANSPLVGTQSGDFTLPMLEGGNFQLAANKGKVVVLDFWATWCGPCVASLPELMAAMKPFPEDKVAFIAVNQAEAAENVKSFLQQRRWVLKVAMDADQKIGRQFGVEGIPHTVVIGPDGKIAHVTTGYVEGGGEKIAEVVRGLVK